MQGNGAVMKLTRRELMAGLPGAAMAAGKPLFSFGVAADIQYADKDDTGPRKYRQSLSKVADWKKAISGEKLEFVVHLGDLFDEGLENLGPALKALRSLHSDVRHVLGNHDYSVPRATVLGQLGLKRAYYDFTVRGWRFVVIDGMDVAAKGGWPEGHQNEVEGRRLLEELKKSGALQANDWNGAAGPAQMEWLRRTLADAAAKRQRAVVFGHFPVLPEACRPDHVMWNYDEVLEALDGSKAAVAYFNGHDHRGGVGVRGGLHYVTFKGLVEHEPQESCRIVDVYADRLALRADAELPLRPPEGAGRWESLFDGKTLEGWRVECKPEDRGKEFWRARDGAIECDSIGRKDHDYVWLITEKEYSDFEAEFEVMGFTESPGNSGLQFRSRYDRELGWLHGPQIDIHPPAPFRVGLIYDETREARRWISPSRKNWEIAPADAPHKFHWNAKGWNRIRLVCEGTRVKTWVNGMPVTNFDGAGVLDDSAHKQRRVGLSGHFALQLHMRDELRIRYRRLRVRRMDGDLRS